MAHKEQTKIGEYKKMEEKITATMQKSISFEKPRIPEGWYDCECIEVKKISDGQYGERIIIVSRIEEQKVDLGKVVYLNLREGTAATEVIQAFGINFVEGKEFDFSELIGKKARAVVEDYEYVLDGEKKHASTVSKYKKLNQTEVEQVK